MRFGQVWFFGQVSYPAVSAPNPLLHFYLLTDSLQTLWAICHEGITGGVRFWCDLVEFNFSAKFRIHRSCAFISWQFHSKLPLDMRLNPFSIRASTHASNRASTSTSNQRYKHAVKHAPQHAPQHAPIWAHFNQFWSNFFLEHKSKFRTLMIAMWASLEHAIAIAGQDIWALKSDQILRIRNCPVWGSKCYPRRGIKTYWKNLLYWTLFQMTSMHHKLRCVLVAVIIILRFWGDHSPCSSCSSVLRGLPRVLNPNKEPMHIGVV